MGSGDLVKRASELRKQNKLLFRFLDEKTIFWDGVYYEMPEKEMKELHNLLDKYLESRS